MDSTYNMERIDNYHITYIVEVIHFVTTSYTIFQLLKMNLRDFVMSLLYPFYLLYYSHLLLYPVTYLVKHKHFCMK